MTCDPPNHSGKASLHTSCKNEWLKNNKYKSMKVKDEMNSCYLKVLANRSHKDLLDVSGFLFKAWRQCTVIKMVLMVSSKLFLGFWSVIHTFSLESTDISGFEPEILNLHAETFWSPLSTVPWRKTGSWLPSSLSPSSHLIGKIENEIGSSLWSTKW